MCVYVCLPRMHVCVRVSVYLCLHVGAHVSVNVHAHAYGGQVLEMRAIFRSFFRCNNWCRLSQLNPELTNAAQLIRLFQGSSVSAFWDLNHERATAPSWQGVGFWEHKLWSSHL